MHYLHKHWQLQFRKVNAFSEKFETYFGKCRESTKIVLTLLPFIFTNQHIFIYFQTVKTRTQKSDLCFKAEWDQLYTWSPFTFVS